MTTKLRSGFRDSMYNQAQGSRIFLTENLEDSHTLIPDVHQSYVVLGLDHYGKRRRKRTCLRENSALMPNQGHLKN